MLHCVVRCGVGEAANPAPDSKRTPTSNFSNTAPVDVEQVLSPAPSPPEVIRALEDLLGHPRAGKACRRVDLVPHTDEEFLSQIAGPTQWESGADFLVRSGGAGLMPSVSPPSPVATVVRIKIPLSGSGGQ